MNKSNLFGFILLALFLAIYGITLAQPVNLVTADLGRHIKNGELFMNGRFDVLRTNLYSFTNSDFSALNHHWLGGVVFFLFWKLFGFAGTHTIFILLCLGAFLLFFRLAKERAGIPIAILLGILALPLLLERNEIRPEVFSYLFAGLFLWAAIRLRENKLNPKILWLLPVVQIIWTNLHIYFFLGPVILGVFALESYLKKETAIFKKFLCVLSAVVIATLLNPFGLKGALAPLSIFKNYGYMLVENQSVWFVERELAGHTFWFFKIVFVLVATSFVLAASFRRKIHLSTWLFGIGFGLAAWLAIRNIAIFGLFALFIISENIGPLLADKDKFQRKLGWACGGVLILVLLVFASGEASSIYPAYNFGFGLEKNNAAAAEFFKKENLAGPIFNNYDIGGYLIFHLWPNERVFVDNRPEAYPADFFQKTYIHMQENENVWREKLKEYGFKTIIFSALDYTPWGQRFLAARIKDPEWKVAFRNERVIIFVKRE